MNEDPLKRLLEASEADPTVRGEFLATWTRAIGLLEDLSAALNVPLWVLSGTAIVYASPLSRLNQFCQALLATEEGRRRCLDDAGRRAQNDDHGASQACHAGVINFRAELNTYVLGSMAVLFGAQVPADQQSAALREEAASVAGIGVERVVIQPSVAITPEILSLVRSAISVAEALFATVPGFRTQTISMTHELTLTMIGLGTLAQALKANLFTLMPLAEPSQRATLERMAIESEQTISETRLSLYVVRNFLSHASSSRYGQLMRPRESECSLREIVGEIAALHRPEADKKGVEIRLDELDEAPPIRGYAMELRRLCHNLINNAIKYSYHSTESSKQRFIRCYIKDPYDPGFRERRFALVFENYGIGISDSERPWVMTAGFRGSRAKAEVPIGSGIGLSEAAKIMRLHNGIVSFQTTLLHRKDGSDDVYLTTVAAIFPDRRIARGKQDGR